MRHRFVRGQNAIDALGGPEFLYAARPLSGFACVFFPHPAAVHVGVVKQVRADLRPSAIRIIAHEARGNRAGLRVYEESRRLAELVAGRPVDLLEIGVDAAGDHPEAQPGGAPGDHLAVASHQECRAGGRERNRHDVHLAPLEFEGLPGPGLPEGFDAGLHAFSAAGEGSAEHGVFLGPVPDGEHVGHPPVAHQVENRHLFGHANGVVEGQHQGGYLDRDPAGPPRQGCGQDEGRGQVAVLAAVVFGKHDLDAAPVLSPLGQFQGRPVELARRRCAEVGGSKVESHQEQGLLLAVCGAARLGAMAAVAVQRTVEPGGPGRLNFPQLGPPMGVHPGRKISRPGPIIRG